MQRIQRFVSRQELLAFLGLTLLLFVSQILSQSTGVWIETFLAWLGISSGWAAGIAFAVLCAVVWIVHTLTRSQPRPGVVTQWVLCLVAFIVLVLSNAVPGWLASSLGVDSFPAFVRVALLLGLLAVWIYLWNRMLPAIRQWFETPVNLATHQGSLPPSGPVSLIALVSKIASGELDLPPHPAPACLKREPGYPLACTSLKQDIRSLRGSRWPWQQLLRAVDRYAPRRGLKIILVGSQTAGPDDQGSHSQLELCKAFLERYPEVAPWSVTIFPHPLDFEDFNQVTRRLRGCIREEFLGVGERRVFVAITGGQKVASAAAAAATIGTMGQFQYVSTKDPSNIDDPPTVIVSDLHPQAVPAAGG